MAGISSSKDSATVERTGSLQFQARSRRKATLTIGYGEGEFTPGDLLELAVLGCSALSSDARFARELGDEYRMSGSVEGKYLGPEDRFTDFLVSLEPDLELLDADDRERLLKRASAAIRRFCTISHTLAESAPTALKIDGEKL